MIDVEDVVYYSRIVNNHMKKVESLFSHVRYAVRGYR